MFLVAILSFGKPNCSSFTVSNWILFRLLSFFHNKNQKIDRAEDVEFHSRPPGAINILADWNSVFVANSLDNLEK